MKQFNANQEKINQAGDDSISVSLQASTFIAGTSLSLSDSELYVSTRLKEWLISILFFLCDQMNTFTFTV
jgi:hypothetical protein